MNITRNETDRAGLERLSIEVDGQEVGYGFLNRHPKYALYSRFGIYEIQDIQVQPEHRQKGYATALIQKCEDIAKSEGQEEIGISVGLTADYGPAQRLYCKLGYLPDGQGITYDRATLKHGDNVTLDDDLCLMMVKTL
jgi:GNAT superfamily N-acetyltransferase